MVIVEPKSAPAIQALRIWVSRLDGCSWLMGKVESVKLGQSNKTIRDDNFFWVPNGGSLDSVTIKKWKQFHRIKVV